MGQRIRRRYGPEHELSRAWWRSVLWLGVLRETVREQFGGEGRMKECDAVKLPVRTTCSSHSDVRSSAEFSFWAATRSTLHTQNG